MKTFSTKILISLFLAGLSFLFFNLKIANACRCAPQNLVDYYKRADLIFFGTITGHKKVKLPKNSLLLKIKAKGDPFKGQLNTSQRFYTGLSTAECGIVSQTQESYLVFAQRDPDHSDILRVDSCNGTRIFSPRGNTPYSDFKDTPASKVMSQLLNFKKLEAPPPKQNFPMKDIGGVPLKNSIIGLLEIPLLKNPTPVEVPIFSQPNLKSKIQTKLKKTGDFKTKESAYEEKSIIVYELRPGWYRIALSEKLGGGSAWIQKIFAGSYHPVDKLVINRLNYLNGNWNGWVFPSPGAGNPIKANIKDKFSRPEYPARILSTQRVAESLWFQVEILESSPCDGDKAKVLLSGWVAAYDPKGEITAWFYSRGC